MMNYFSEWQQCIFVYFGFFYVKIKAWKWKIDEASLALQYPPVAGK